VKEVEELPPGMTDIPESIQALMAMTDTEKIYQCLLCGIRKRIKKSTQFPILASNFYRDFVLSCW